MQIIKPKDNESMKHIKKFTNVTNCNSKLIVVNILSYRYDVTCKEIHMYLINDTIGLYNIVVVSCYYTIHNTICNKL